MDSNKLINEVWEINTTGNGGLDASTDIAFGTNADGAPAIRVGNNIITGEGGGGESSIITVIRDCEMTYDGSEEEVGYFNATIPAYLFPSDFKIAGKYNLIVTITGLFADEAPIGYTANHFCYMSGDDMTVMLCEDNLPTFDVTHSTQLGRNGDEDYMLQYQGKLGVDCPMLPNGAKVSIYLQKLY